MTAHRVVVCGTRFGEAYLSALLEEQTDCRLVGILARGSGRSQRLAETLGVPLYRRVQDLPERIDIACVVLRSKAFGGIGSEIAEALLARGIHVLQEHPVAASEIARLGRTARGAGVCYQVNSCYGHGRAVRMFTEFVRRWRTQRSPHYVSVTTSSQLLYSSFDILGRAFGSLSGLVLSDPAPWPPAALARAAHGTEPFRVMPGLLDGVPFVLQLQCHLDPRDPDQHSLVQHRICVGGPEGTVELCNSFGPVVWTRAIHLPDHARDDAGASYLANWDERYGQADQQRPTAVALTAGDGPSLAATLRDEFPAMITAALAELLAAIEGRPDRSAFQDEAYLMDLAQCWQATMRRAGPLTEVALPAPPAPYPDPAGFREAFGHG